MANELYSVQYTPYFNIGSLSRGPKARPLQSDGNNFQQQPRLTIFGALVLTKMKDGPVRARASVVSDGHCQSKNASESESQHQHAVPASPSNTLSPDRSKEMGLRGPKKEIKMGGYGLRRVCSRRLMSQRNH